MSQDRAENPASAKRDVYVEVVQVIAITINELDESGALHPLFQQYVSQNGPQRAFICFDRDTRTLSADFYGEIGGGCFARTFENRDIEFDINPQLTAAEINGLMRDIAPACAELTDSDFGESDHADAREIQRVCQITTESGGVWDAADFFDGGPAPTSREEALDAASDHEGGVTLIGLDGYLEDVAEDAAIEAEQRGESK